MYLSDRKSSTPPNCSLPSHTLAQETSLACLKVLES